MQRAELSLDSSLREIFSHEESRTVFDKFLPGIREHSENQPAVLGFSARKVIAYAGQTIPPETADALDTALQALELYTEAPKLADAPLTPDGTEIVREPPHDAIYPGKVWRDTSGRRIQAHGGALYYENGYYYWYGENKDRTTGQSEVWTWGMRAYRSADLCNWEDLGLFILPDFSNRNAPMHPASHADRPHIIKCVATGKYVCWIKHSGEAACFSVMQADSLLGPYEVKQHHYRPFGYKVGDFDISVCGETAYLYMDADHRGLVTLRLSADFLTAEEEICRQYEGLHAPFCREGPAVFMRDGKWYMLTSGMTGYVPNKSDCAVSDAPDKPFVSIGDPHIGDASRASFNSQISQVFKVPGKKELYIALADRWVPDYPVDARLADLLERCTAQKFDPEHYAATQEEMQVMLQSPMLDSANTSRADYVWLPITFENGNPKIYWRDSWKPSDFS
ncbi:family 43 glycosylhydrolase [Gemmiger sp.]